MTLKQRHPAGMALEVLIPAIFILLVGLLKTTMVNTSIPAGWSGETKEGMAYNLFDRTSGKIDGIGAPVPLFYMHEATMTGLILSLGAQAFKNGHNMQELSTTDLAACKKGLVVYGAVTANASSPHKIPEACGGKMMDVWYPRIKSANGSSVPKIPSLRESIEFYSTADDLETYVSSDAYGSGPEHPRNFGAIVFDQFPSDLEVGKFSSIEYTVRMNSTGGARSGTGLIPLTIGDPPELTPFDKELTTDYYSRYAVSRFMTLQTLVTRFVTCMPTWDLSKKRALLKPLRQAPQPYLGAAVAPFPIDAFEESPFCSKIKTVFPIIFIQAYLYCLSRILVAFIYEKESRQRELMKILGVSEASIITSWYITYGLILLVGTLIQVLAGLTGLFANSSPIVMFIFFYLFGLSMLAFAFCVSAIFSKARAGSLVGLIVFFIMYFVSSSFSAETSSLSKSLGCLLPPVALSLGVQSVANLEATGQGVTFSNISTVSKNFRLSSALLVLIVDIVLYTLVGIYFEKVVPKEWGTTQKWYFPVSPSYWRGRRARASSQTDAIGVQSGPAADDLILDVNPTVEPVNSELHEQERKGEVLSVQRLRKEFAVPGGTKVAVKGLNLVMYKDQITCLLGHNGAGKTTLISMLTGMIAPSSGTATFQGMSFTEDMDEIRQSLGICFQHDVLYADLSVEEHLYFYGRIKGYTQGELTEVVNRQIKEVGLTEKRGVKSSDLSGGMKRKLSVAISLLGDSSLVFLDEPTSGMDPYSRRSTWEILLNNRNGRVMVLTTHFMDEADILGDRIAIMAEGELRCCGSSLFLKNRYGAGYNLTLVKDDKHCNDSEVIDFVTMFVPNAQVLSNVGSEIAFQLPLDASHIFARMFAELDNRLPTLGLLSYGVSVTTLEEVFIKVAEADDDGQQHTLNKLARQDTIPVLGDMNSTINAGSHVSKESLFVMHLPALLLKRFRVAKRDRKIVRHWHHHQSEFNRMARAAATHEATTRTSAATLHPTDRPGTTTLATYLSGDHARWQSNYWSRTLATSMRERERDRKMVIFSTILPVILITSGLAVLKSGNGTVNDPKIALSTDAYEAKDQSPTPYFCQANGDTWCSAAMFPAVFTGAKPEQLSNDVIKRYDSSSPMVFNVTYKYPSVDLADATGYGLRLGEEL
ncbi:hypothetical protein Poli38472_014240 [Pythium oligandrum]|uniref:ABC transporter domain-containing protein n=1 Tax=Pythium oligandrum TaxID=41045 RepID=A0A8K1FMZ2_PYTOL|nr:hypothetical protein Poli38472_014240 [Pythium oligandrum]|eukprot:TMW64123.1 hypothetical protein Poli38472_014240 [Pythium oligandrum]